MVCFAGAQNRVYCLVGEISNFRYLPPGGGQEVQRLWHPQRDDRHLEVPEQRLHTRGVHQHLPQWQRDRDSLRRRSQEAGQISSSVLTSTPLQTPLSTLLYTSPLPSTGTDVLIHEKEKKNSGLLFLLSSSRANPNAWTLFSIFFLFFSSFYEDLLFSWSSKRSPPFTINCFCFSFADECCEKQPDMCISAYRCREPRHTHSLISDLQADLWKVTSCC